MSEEEEYDYEGEEWEEKAYYELDDGKFEITDEYVTESKPIRMLYEFGWVGELPGPIKGKSGAIIRRAFKFCKDRGEIKKEHWKNKNILQKKLKVFDDDFFQRNQEDAIDFADVACRLQIRSLYYLMKERAAEMLAKKTPDEIRELFKVHYVKDTTTDDVLDLMKWAVSKVRWPFRSFSS